jgi:alkylation response protein AidB-like acyl-CoA dehydrogenase/predicted heme/steroid binding protein
MSKADTIYTLEQVKAHNTPEDAWIVVRGFVYDVTKFAKYHPGGKKVLLRFAGTECTQEFDQHHNELVMFKYHKKFCIGKIAAPKRRPDKYTKMLGQTGLSHMLADPENSVLPIFGDLFPFGDPTWYQGWVSPYYKGSHKKIRALCRKFVDERVIPNVHRWDEAKKIPKSFFLEVAKTGLLPLMVGNKWPAKYVTYPPPAGIDPDEFDNFHELILIDELSRSASGGVLWGLAGGLAIGLPPVLQKGSEELKERVVRPCLAGEKTICLAITEPWGGSDVANLQTTAVKSECGKFYIVNGEKKWITNGVFADFFTTAVRTGGPGMGGVSLLLIPRSEGVVTRQMNCMGVWASGTTYITFEDVKVPVENLIGKENKGFKYIMNNFNHERWSIVCQANRFARVCLEESLKFALRRRAFDKRLIDQPVIREKIAEMGRRVMATHAALEDLTYQFMKMPKMLQPLALGGHTALLKVQATKTLEYCASEAAQVLGGCSYTRDGQGNKVERLYREVKAYAIPGGSEEIMREIGVRQTLKVSEVIRTLIAQAKRDQATSKL